MPIDSANINQRILMLSEEKDMLTPLNRTLTLEGFDVIVVCDYDEASSLFDSLNPDMVIMDGYTPDADSLRILDTIRKRSNVPIIVITADNEPETLKTIFAHGADDFINKPFGIRPFIARIKAKLKRFQADTQLTLAPASPIDIMKSTTTYEAWLDSIADKDQSYTTNLPKQHDKDISKHIDNLFSSALEAEFEDGITNSFSKGLLDVVRNNGIVALQHIAYLINNNIVNNQLSAEALRWLARMDDASTHDYRLWLLEKCLFSKFSSIRDAAILGLDSMHDLHSIPFLENAISKETISELAEDMSQVLKDLKDAVVSKKDKKS